MKTEENPNVQYRDYIIFYDNNAEQVKAHSSYHAWCQAIETFKPPKSRKYLVQVHLADKEIVL